MRRQLMSLAVLAAAVVAQNQPEAARRQSIKSSMDAILAECQTSADGDWRKWFDALAPFRERLSAEMNHASRFNTRKGPHPAPFLIAKGNPPLLASVFAGRYLNPPTADPVEWAEHVSSVAALKATRNWLKTRGVDLIVVPVPTVLDVYPDRFVNAPTVPENRIVQPHVRKLFYDLLKSDVEVVDLLPLFLEARKRNDEPLFLVGDIHWGPPAWRITAQALAARLRRYQFVNEAAHQPPVFVSKRTPRPAMTPPTLLWEYLSPSERQAIGNYLQPEYDAISRVDGKPADPKTSPVVILGDSFAPMISLQLSQAINLAVATHSVDGASLQPLKEMLRTQNAVSEAKVVIWIASYATYLLMDWSGLPELVVRS